jgi:hypothetical protein
MTIRMQPDLPNEELRALLTPYLARYDDGYDDQLSGLQHKSWVVWRRTSPLSPS